MDRRQYFRQFLIVLTGNGAAQVLNLLSYPFLARLYTPHAFGGFAIFVAATAIPGAIACGRFDLAVPIAPRSGRFGILWLCASIAAAVGLLSILGAALYWQLSGAPGGVLLPILFGFTVTFTGLSLALSSFVMRHDRYRTQSLSVLARTGGAVIAQVVLGLFAPTSLSLILGFVVGLLAQTIVLAGAVFRNLNPKMPRIRDMRAMFWRFRGQVAVDIPSSLLASFSFNLLTLLLGVLYDQRTVGYLAVGQRLAMVPLQLFNDALGQVFYQKAAASHRTSGSFWAETKLHLVASCAISIAVLLAIWIAARPFITLYLGTRWAPAAGILITLAPMLVARTVASALLPAAYVLRRPHWLLIHNAATVTVTLLAFGIAHLAGLGVLPFLALAATFLVAEYATFTAVLTYTIKTRHLRVTRKVPPVGETLGG